MAKVERTPTPEELAKIERRKMFGGMEAEKRRNFLAAGYDLIDLYNKLSPPGFEMQPLQDLEYLDKNPEPSLGDLEVTRDGLRDILAAVQRQYAELGEKLEKIEKDLGL